MDIVVYLALAVLAAVFLFSLFILISMCHRRYEYNRLLMAHSLRFSKLRQDNLDDITQLGPHISQKLSSNLWVEEVSGILQNCASVLKLCHLLTDKMAQISLNQINPQLNEVICQSTTHVVPRFDILLRSMAAKNIDLRVIEARVSALVMACWSLVTPFYLINPKYQETLGSILQEMEFYHSHLLMALEHVESDSLLPQSSTSNNSTSNGGAAIPPHSGDNIAEEREPIVDDQNFQQTSVNFSVPPPITNLVPENQDSSPLVEDNKLSENLSLLNGGPITLKSKIDEATDYLLNDEAPADPSCS